MLICAKIQGVLRSFAHAVARAMVAGKDRGAEGGAGAGLGPAAHALSHAHASRYIAGVCIVMAALFSGAGWAHPGLRAAAVVAPPARQPAAQTGSTDRRPSPAIGSFSASLFKFKTTVEDDGTDKGGGEQQASATLAFVDVRHDPPPAWICNVTIKMPLRTAKYGKISASQAAEISTKVTTKASSAVIHTRDSWQPTLFCKEFQDKMNDIFYYEYSGLGGRATAKR
jgi:hypothetical protein